MHVPVWVIEEFKFYICPLQWLSLHIRFWYQKYKNIKDGICQPVNYNLTSAKFFEAINIYEFYLNKFTRQKLESKKQDDGFKKLRDSQKWLPKKKESNIA